MAKTSFSKLAKCSTLEQAKSSNVEEETSTTRKESEVEPASTEPKTVEVVSKEAESTEKTEEVSVKESIVVLSSDDESAKNESSIICMGEKEETVLSGYDDDTDEFDAEETEKVAGLDNSHFVRLAEKAKTQLKQQCKLI